MGRIFTFSSIAADGKVSTIIDLRRLGITRGQIALLGNAIAAASGSIEVLVNGGFDSDTDWDKGTHWTIPGSTGGTAGVNVDGGALLGDPLAQATALVDGGVYDTEFDMLNYVTGKARLSLGTTTSQNGTIRQANGTYNEQITASGGTSFSVNAIRQGVAPNDDYQFDVDNVSATIVGISGGLIVRVYPSIDGQLFSDRPIYDGLPFRTISTARTLSADADPGDVTITLNSTSGLVAGQGLLIAPQTQAEQLRTIASISGSVVTLTERISLAVASGGSVKPINVSSIPLHVDDGPYLRVEIENEKFPGGLPDLYALAIDGETAMELVP